MTYDFDYYGNMVKYSIEGDVDGHIVTIESTQFPIEDSDEEEDIKFHCGMDYADKAHQHYLKTGEPL